MRIAIPATLLVALLVAGPAAGQEIRFASYGDIQTAYQAQNQEITHLRTRLAALEATADEGSDCQTCESCCSDPCCCGRSCGLVGSAELLFLKAHAGGGMRGFTGQDVEFGYDMAPRITLGVSDSTGLGGRVRWTEFNHMADAAHVAGTDTVDFNISVMDLEATLASQLGTNWDALVFGGLRHVDYSQTLAWYNVNGALAGEVMETSGGIGLTVGGELRRNVYRNLSVFGGVRASVMMADEGVRFALAPVNNLTVVDTVKYIWETQLGAELTQTLPSGGLFFLRGAFEVQCWDGYNVNPWYFGAGEFDAIGLGGFTLGAGIMR